MQCAGEPCCCKRTTINMIKEQYITVTESKVIAEEFGFVLGET